MTKKVAVLWSGGLDSTYLIHKNLEEGNCVLPVYVTITQNDRKTKMELHAMKKLHSMFYSKWGERIRPIHHAMDIRPSFNHTLEMVQPPIWMLGVLMSPLYDCDEVQIGYIMKDDALSYLTEMEKIFNLYKEFMHESSAKTDIVFPIIKEHKTTLVRKLPDEYLQLTVFCEDATILDTETDDGRIHVDCGYCDQCKTYKFWNLFHRWNRNIDRRDESMEKGEPLRPVETEYNSAQLMIPFEEYLVTDPLEDSIDLHEVADEDMVAEG